MRNNDLQPGSNRKKVRTYKKVYYTQKYQQKKQQEQQGNNYTFFFTPQQRSIDKFKRQISQHQRRIQKSKKQAKKSVTVNIYAVSGQYLSPRKQLLQKIKDKQNNLKTSKEQMDKILQKIRNQTLEKEELIQKRKEYKNTFKKLEKYQKDLSYKHALTEIIQNELHEIQNEKINKVTQDQMKIQFQSVLTKNIRQIKRKKEELLKDEQMSFQEKKKRVSDNFEYKILQLQNNLIHSEFNDQNQQLSARYKTRVDQYIAQKLQELETQRKENIKKMQRERKQKKQFIKRFEKERDQNFEKLKDKQRQETKKFRLISEQISLQYQSSVALRSLRNVRQNLQQNLKKKQRQYQQKLKKDLKNKIYINQEKLKEQQKRYELQLHKVEEKNKKNKNKAKILLQDKLREISQQRLRVKEDTVRYAFLKRQQKIEGQKRNINRYQGYLQQLENFIQAICSMELVPSSVRG